jgi:quinol monooxygenase YgiN
MPVQFAEMDDRVTFAEQLAHETGTVVLINTFTMDAADIDRFLATWATDAALMKQAGCISIQLHRGTAGSTTFVNVAVWESAQRLREALAAPEFRANLALYPESALAKPHLFEKVAVPGICVA